MFMLQWLGFDGAPWVLATLGAVGLAVWAGRADRARLNRTDLDAVGFMPWRAIVFWSMVAALLCGAVALRIAVSG
jgi:hypothetical protein